MSLIQQQFIQKTDDQSQENKQLTNNLTLILIVHFGSVFKKH